MNQEKIGEFIKKLRQDNNLTQKDLAKKYNVTYQAVSKWERGLNIPDISLLKQMSEDFNISIEELLSGETTEIKPLTTKRKKIHIIGLAIDIVALLTLIIILLLEHNSTYHFRKITSPSNDFNITGSIAYDDKKTSIYISNIEYTGTEEEKFYKQIECSIYQKLTDYELNLGSKTYNIDTPATLAKIIDEVSFNLEKLENNYKSFSSDSFYLLISVTDTNGKETIFKVPLFLSKVHN